MKYYKLLTFICTVSIIAAFAAGCNKKPKEEQAAAEKEIAALPVVSPESQKKTNFALVDANTCMTNEDCVAVFPTCCGEANPPFYVNKEYQKEFIKEYKRINREETCPVAQQCPISYFGMATKTVCKKNICIEAMSIAASMPEPVVPVELKKKQAAAKNVAADKKSADKPSQPVKKAKTAAAKVAPAKKAEAKASSKPAEPTKPVATAEKQEAPAKTDKTEQK